MSRNGSGTYALPANSLNPAVAGQAIDASDFNDTAADIADALSASLAKDGQTTATARIPFAQGASSMVGTVGSVSYGFTSDLNTGIYSPAADKGGLVAGGTEIVRWESGLFSPVLTNTIDLGTTLLKYKDAYFAGAVTLATLTFSGTDPYPKKATTNTFTRGQTITGSADEIQLLVTANATQTSNTFVVEKSDGTDVFLVGTTDAFVTVKGNLNVLATQNAKQLFVRGAATQTSPIVEIEKNDTTDLFTLDNSGNLMTAGYVTKAVATSQATPADPTGTTNTSGKMMGLAGSITPQGTGKIVIMISGSMTQSTNLDGGKVQIRYGTGSAPANADDLTGTAVGNLVSLNFTTAASSRLGWSCHAVVTGLTPATAYWLDVGLAAVTGGTASVKDVSITAYEL